MPLLPEELRGTRRTRPFAWALAGVVATGTAVVGLTLAWGVLRGIQSGQSIELMKIDAPGASIDPADFAGEQALEVAPSRPSPAGMEGLIEADHQLRQREAELVRSTADNGPQLGAESTLPAWTQWQTLTFDGRPLRPVRTVRMLTTAYSPDARSCGKWADGITASGYSVWTNGMKLVAADTDLLPFGSIVTVPGYHGGRPVPVLDRGGAIKGHRLDVLYPTHERALRWGAQRLDVTVWEYAD
ncbi:MAG: 3D domain-containing protein [Planctomycetota bacterium]